MYYVLMVRGVQSRSAAVQHLSAHNKVVPGGLRLLLIYGEGGLAIEHSKVFSVVHIHYLRDFIEEVEHA